MAGNHALTGALAASILLHASLLLAPLHPFGLALATRPAVLQVRLPPPLPPAAAQLPAAPAAAVTAAADAAFTVAAGTAGGVGSIGGVGGVGGTGAHPAPAPTSAITHEPSSAGRGSDPAALLAAPFTPPALYYRPHELTRRPTLKRPVLQEEAGRLYPLSETLLLVRINESGHVDEVVLLSATQAAMAGEAIAAFRQAEYFPGMIGRAPAKAELLIQVMSSGTGIVIR